MSYSFFFKKSISSHAETVSSKGAKLTSLGPLVSEPVAYLTAIPGALVGGLVGAISGVAHGLFVSLTRNPKSEEELKSFEQIIESVQNNTSSDHKQLLLESILQCYNKQKRNSSNSSLALIENVGQQQSITAKFDVLVNYLSAKAPDNKTYYNNGKLLFNIAYNLFPVFHNKNVSQVSPPCKI